MWALTVVYFPTVYTKHMKNTPKGLKIFDAIIRLCLGIIAVVGLIYFKLFATGTGLFGVQNTVDRDDISVLLYSLTFLGAVIIYPFTSRRLVMIYCGLFVLYGIIITMMGSSTDLPVASLGTILLFLAIRKIRNHLSPRNILRQP